MKFIVHKELFNIFEDLNIHFLIINNFKNVYKNKKETKILLNDSINYAETKHLTKENFTDNDVIREYRNIFSKIKTKKGARSAIESLLKRINQKKGLGLIDPLVDIYNIVSIKYGIAIGAEDLDKIKDNLYLGFANTSMKFHAIGEDKLSNPVENEVVYHDDEKVIVRSLNWRESKLSMIDDNTENAIIVFETFTKEQEEKADLVINDLKKLIKNNYDKDIKNYKINKENNEMEITYDN